MGISDKMSQLATNVQEGMAKGSTSLLTLSLKVISAVVLGLTFALVGQELSGYGMFLFIFVLLVTGTMFYNFIKNFSISQVLIFDLFCVLVGMLLRMYILIAP